MATRAKFQCQRIEEMKYLGGQSTKVVLTAVTTYNSPEDKPFWDATPSGEIILNIVNEAAVKQFTPGKKYYVDFTEVDES